MTTSVADKRAAFRRLHDSGCFVIPNPWDVGSARYLQHLGFKALATTSAGFAWSIGRRDNAAAVEDVLAHLQAVSSSTNIPVNADFEGGFADAPDDVARNVAAAVAAGVAGLSIEDSRRGSDEPLYDFTLAVERIEAARHAIDEHSSGVLLTGRSEGFIVGRPDLKETIRRLTAYAEAGADCLYAPGLKTREDVEAVVRAVAPKPVNVLAASAAFTVVELAEIGVRRISVGGALARAAWAAFMHAASEIAEKGTFTGLAQGASGTELNGLF